ncbi:hypothetical protein Peur_026512 [Populus x canadensis]
MSIKRRVSHRGSLIAGRWLDLLSGTGSVGIEAISRGCSQAHVFMVSWYFLGCLLSLRILREPSSVMLIFHDCKDFINQFCI